MACFGGDALYEVSLRSISICRFGNVLRDRLYDAPGSMGSPDNMTSPGRRRYLRPHRILICHFFEDPGNARQFSKRTSPLTTQDSINPQPCLLSSKRLWLVQSYSDRRVCRFQLHHSRYSSILSRLDQQQLTSC
jgi:hypothetical protein